jgi:hypothetical protein
VLTLSSGSDVRVPVTAFEGAFEGALNVQRLILNKVCCQAARDAVAAGFVR